MSTTPLFDDVGLGRTKYGYTVLFRSGSSDPLIEVVVDACASLPIEINGEPATIDGIKSLRKALKKAIKVAERYHGGRA